MMEQITRDQLKELRLAEMIAVVDNQDNTVGFSTMPFDERFKILVSQFYEEKKHKRIIYLIKSAKLRFNCTMSDIRYPEERIIDRPRIEALGTCNFLRSHSDIILYGPTGCGKTFLACAIGNAACRLAKKVLYTKHDELIDDYLSSDIQGKRKLIDKLSSVELLIIDEWLQEEPTEEAINFMFKVIEKRNMKGSTIFCTQYHPDEWYSRMKGCTQTEALIDRVFSAAIDTRIDLGTYNMRKHVATGGTMS